MARQATRTSCWCRGETGHNAVAKGYNAEAEAAKACSAPVRRKIAREPFLGGAVLTEKERREKKSAEIGRKCWFLADFGPEFLPPQIIKSDSIYRLWKRAILSTLGKNFSP
ncbi:hypothetical protein NC651_027018 [Populus alba x Populus x berolinensis]|nr:hypothetical protein NC651_027018 [Populus alba x Populus x berolinensis]